MAKAKAFEYEDIKGHLKETFNAFIVDATKFGVDAETAAEIADMNSLKAKGLWMLFKKQFKIKLAQLELEDLADTLIGDLEEDNILVVSKDTLERILANPEDERYELEADMIAQIKSMSNADKADLRDQVAQNMHLGDLGDHAEPTISQKILSFLKGLWIKLAPVIDKIFDVVVGIGAEALKAIVTKEIGNDLLADALEDGIDGAAAVVKDLGDEKENGDIVELANGVAAASLDEAVVLAGDEAAVVES